MEAVAHRFHEYEIGQPLDGLSALLHAEARMNFLRADLGPLQGRQAILDVLTETRWANLYSATVTRCEWIDDWTLLVEGRARYAATSGRGITDTQVWWVDEFLDGALWRIDVFTSESALEEFLTPDPVTASP